MGSDWDAESWYSVTPEIVAWHIARRTVARIPRQPLPLVVDAFCGAGGNAIQFAAAGALTLCVDADPAKAALCAHNAQIYGVRGLCEIVVGDFCRLRLSSRAADAVFLSPPWGGPSHVHAESGPFALAAMRPVSGQAAFAAARRVSPAIAFYLPRNVCARDVALLDARCELETHYLNGRPHTATAYFGPLCSSSFGERNPKEDSSPP